MEGKKSFVFYTDWYDTFKQLPKDKGYDLLMHILAYVNDENPETDDFLINALFAQFKSILKRDLDKWENRQIQRKEAGIRSAEARKIKSTTVQRKSTKINDRSISSGVNVNVNVNDNSNILNDSTCINHSTSLNHSNTESENFQKKEKPGKRTKSVKSVFSDLTSPNYQKFIEIYFDWFKKLVGVEPKFSASDGRAMKSIVAYIEKITNRGAPPDAWKLILDSHEKWDPFYRNQKKINQIESNLINILDNIKNGVYKNGRINPLNERSERSRKNAEALEIANRQYLEELNNRGVQ